MITPIWRARLFRTWLVIGVPLACWTAYEAWDAYQKIDFWNAQIESWSIASDQERTGKSIGIVDPHKYLTEAYQYRNENAELANILPWIAAMLLTLPILGALILKIFEWVWSGPTSVKEDGSQAFSSKSWKNLISSKRAKWGMGIGGLLVFTGIMYSLSPDSTTSTLIQVFVQVGVVGAVLALIKFFRR
jgi:hypothetical protein